jgi:hypothetical protein
MNEEIKSTYLKEECYKTLDHNCFPPRAEYNGGTTNQSNQNKCEKYSEGGSFEVG